MKTNTLRKFIIASSLGLGAIATAAPTPIRQTDKLVKTHDIQAAVMPTIRIIPTPTPPRPTCILKTASVAAPQCLPNPAGENSDLPLLMPKPSFSIRNLLGVTGNDGGCIPRPGKPTRPIPTPFRA